MPIRKKLSDARSREFWRLAQEASRTVADWPSWKRESVTKEMSCGEFVRQIQQSSHNDYHAQRFNDADNQVVNTDRSDKKDER
jgi:hypothetical protein